MIDPNIDPVITLDARVVEPSTPVTDAAEELRDPSVPLLVVLDGTDDLVGVVTESDLVALLAETDDLTTVEAAMSAPVTTIRPSATVTEAATRMREAGVEHLPVVDAQGTYCGVVSASTLAPYCSRRSLDVEWTGEPLRVDASGPTGVTAGK